MKPLRVESDAIISSAAAAAVTTAATAEGFAHDGEAFSDALTSSRVAVSSA